MLPNGVRNDVGQVAGDVISTFGWRDANLIESTNGNIRRSENRLAIDERVWTRKQAQCPLVKGIVLIVEHLVEVADAKEHLVGETGRENRIQNQRVILHVDGSNFKIVS